MKVTKVGPGSGSGGQKVLPLNQMKPEAKETGWVKDAGPAWQETKKTGYARCFEGHQPLSLGVHGGVELFVHGGSCNSPAVKDADVYIGFDAGMQLTERRYPWNPGDEVHFKLPDGTAPKGAAQQKEWAKLVTWAAQQILAGRKVHAGCIGGHGRTGTFLACLVREMRPEITDAIGYVREHYCPKAVESREQVDFLVKEWGCAKADPRPYGTGGHGSIGVKSYGAGVSRKSSANDVPYDVSDAILKAKTTTTGKPVKSSSNIWGTTKIQVG